MENTNILNDVFYKMLFQFIIVFIIAIIALILLRALFSFVMAMIDNMKSYKLGISYRVFDDYLLVDYKSYEKHKQQIINKEFELGNILNVDSHYYPVEIISKQKYTYSSAQFFGLFSFKRQNKYNFRLYKEDKPSPQGDNIENFQGIYIKDSITGNIESSVENSYANEISEIVNNTKIDDEEREFLLETINTLIATNKVSKKNAKEFLDISSKVVTLGQAIPSLIRAIQNFL